MMSKMKKLGLLRVMPSDKTQKSLLTLRKQKRRPASILPQRAKLHLTKRPTIFLFLGEPQSHNPLIPGHPLLSLNLWIYPPLWTTQTTSAVQTQILTYVRLIIAYITNLFHLRPLPEPSLPSVHESIPHLFLPFPNLSTYLV